MDDGSGSGTDGAEVAGYRPVSVPAVAAALLGVVSAMALVSPVFWAVPIAGVAVAVAALVDVARRDAPKAGRLVALAGLGLALGFGTQAIAGAAVGEWLARGRAESAVRFWVETIAAGRLDDARSMCDGDAAPSVARLAACGAGATPGVRYHGRDDEFGGRVVRVTVGDCAFDVTIGVASGPEAAELERFSVARCAPVTPSAK